MRSLIAAAVLALLAPSTFAQTLGAPRDPPSLVVILVVDQFSANLFDQYRSRFTGGLQRLANEGHVYINGCQSHAVTTTCPGHSTVLSGKHPARMGIPSNSWVDPTTGQGVYCLAAPKNTLAHGRNTDNGPVGPAQMQASTLGVWLKAVSPASRIFGVSGKDRGAITLAGHAGDGAFWFTDDFGLTTYVEPSQSPADRLAPVAAFNGALRASFAAEPPT